jgi:hypothetical protein
MLTAQITPEFRRSVNICLYLRQCVLENREYGISTLDDDAWQAHRLGDNVVTEKLFREYCAALSDGYKSWQAYRIKKAGGAQYLQQYEKDCAELVKRNWERTVRGWGLMGDTVPSNVVTWKEVEEEIVLRWLRDGDDNAIRRFYIGKGTSMSVNQ